jgi:hypothetical protein
VTKGLNRGAEKVVPMRAIWYQRSVVARLTVAILVALLLGQALASPTLALVEVCTATCPDDGPDGTCAPTCADCGCCGHASRNLIADRGTSKPVPDAARCTLSGADLHPRAAFPQDVFHVPRLHLADA